MVGLSRQRIRADLHLDDLASGAFAALDVPDEVRAVIRVERPPLPSGARFVDAGIIGSPPRPAQTRTKLYTSGEHASELQVLGQPGFEVRIVGPQIGQASTSA